MNTKYPIKAQYRDKASGKVYWTKVVEAPDGRGTLTVYEGDWVEVYHVRPGGESKSMLERRPRTPEDP